MKMMWNNISVFIKFYWDIASVFSFTCCLWVFCNALPSQNWTVSAKSKNHHPGGVTVGSWTECIGDSLTRPSGSPSALWPTGLGVATRTCSHGFKAMDEMYHPVPAWRDPLHLLPTSPTRWCRRERIQAGQAPKSHSWLGTGISASRGQWTISENCATGSLSVSWAHLPASPLQSVHPRPSLAAQCLVPTVDAPGPGLQAKCLSHASHWTLLPICGA